MKALGILLTFFVACTATPHALVHEISVRPRERRRTQREGEFTAENPNGWDPLFDWTQVHDGGLLEQYNVTYQDLINKPIEAIILMQEIYERSQELLKIFNRNS